MPPETTQFPNTSPSRGRLRLLRMRCLPRGGLSFAGDMQMVKRIEVNAGERYGLLTIIQEAECRRTPKGFPYRMFHCRCECGNTVTSPLANLRYGKTRSCGCLVGKSSHPRHGHRPKGSASPT